MTAADAKPKPKQPQDAKTVVARQRKLTVEDVRRKAERVQEVARDEVRQVMQMDLTKTVMYAAVGVAVLAGVAYWAGSRAGRRSVRKLEIPASPMD